MGRSGGSRVVHTRQGASSPHERKNAELSQTEDMLSQTEVLRTGCDGGNNNFKSDEFSFIGGKLFVSKRLKIDLLL